MKEKLISAVLEFKLTLPCGGSDFVQSGRIIAYQNLNSRSPVGSDVIAPFDGSIGHQI